jgi:pSer/pThr/pTyr-binding forkhead associated (FHA) protein
MTKTIAFLKPLTPEAEISLGTRLFQIPKFPFRVGRESRRSQTANYPSFRRRAGTALSNDLFLIENEPPLNVSREHFQIELRNDRFFVVDRGSTCGTLVEGIAIGGNRHGGQHLLLSGDVLIVGTSESRHIYKFIVTQPD